MTRRPGPVPLGPRHRAATRLIGRFYTRFGSRYDALVTAKILPLLAQGGRDTVAAWLAAERPTAPVLDLPTGTGEYLDLLPTPVVGLDLAEGMLHRAAERHPGALLVQGDAFRLPFPDGAFASVVTVLGLHILPRPAAVVPELARVLRTGGLLLGAVPLISPYLPSRHALARSLDVPALRLDHLERRRLLMLFRARRTPDPT